MHPQLFVRPWRNAFIDTLDTFPQSQSQIQARDFPVRGFPKSPTATNFPNLCPVRSISAIGVLAKRLVDEATTAVFHVHFNYGSTVDLNQPIL